MPTYAISRHACQRARERFADLGPHTAGPAAWEAWLQRLAQGASPVKTAQSGMDLLLCASAPAADGAVAVYLAVIPLGGRDRWLVRTVLTATQVRANLRLRHRACQQASQQRWRERRCDRQRPWAA
jgi:hypothetical protein